MKLKKIFKKVDHKNNVLLNEINYGYGYYDDYKTRNFDKKNKNKNKDSLTLVFENIYNTLYDEIYSKIEIPI